MIKNTILLAFAALFFFSSIAAKDPEPSFDRKERGLALPKYRNCKTAFSGQDLEKELSPLFVSASGQPVESDFLWIQSQVPKNFKIIIVDLRKEAHGYINGEPILWNANQEEALLEQLAKKPSVSLSDRSGHHYQVIPKSAISEQMMVEQLGMEYKRFPSSHAKEPPKECVDQFVAFVDGLDGHTWIHLHCREGWSRTTLYLAMLDMLKNADKLSFDEIIERQHSIGGANMSQEQELSKQFHFLKKFYLFAKLRKKGSFRLWSEHLAIPKCDLKTRGYLSALKDTDPNPDSNCFFEPKLPQILNQNFIHLGEGASSIAFVSEDGKYVLKLFKMRDAKNEEEILKRFLGYRFAIESNRDNTGMLYWHLKETNGLGQTTLFDKVERQGNISFCLLESISLDQLIFALQLKTKNLGGLIKHAVRKKDNALIAHYLTRVFDLYEAELQKGLIDIDPKFIYNIGFIENKPIRYDASHLRKYSSLSQKELHSYKKGVLKHFAQWVQRGNLEGKGEIMETIVRWIHQFPEANHIN